MKFALIGRVRQVKTRSMENRPIGDIRVDVTDALAWWREAGVDCDFHDEPARWIAEPDSASRQDDPAAGRARAKPAKSAEAIPAPASGLSSESLPTELTAFQRWWMEDPALEGGRTGGRIPPRGPAGAPLMILVAEPESADRERLLSGAGGRLLDAMLAAFSIAPEEAYVASALPCHSPGFDWAGKERQELAPVTIRHIVLAAPQRLMVLGFNILPLLGHEPPHGPQVLPSFKHEGVNIPMLAARGTEAMCKRPSWKTALWRAWLDWD